MVGGLTQLISDAAGPAAVKSASSGRGADFSGDCFPAAVLATARAETRKPAAGAGRRARRQCAEKRNGVPL
jgi:hypothetical protein